MRNAMDPWSGREIKTGRDADQLSADELVVVELGRSTKTYRASVALAREGFGEQAAMLNRSLFEGTAVAHWVHANPDEAAESFHDAALYDRHLLSELVERIGWTDEVDAKALEAAKLTEEDAARLKVRFGRHGDRLWTGHDNLWKLVSAIEDQWPVEGRRQLWEFVEVAHRDNNKLLHSTTAGLARSVWANESSSLELMVGPSTTNIERALFGAYWIYLQTVTLVWDRFELPGRNEFDQLQIDQQRRFHRFTKSDIKGIGRNDPCPCGSEKKFKACHWDQVHRT